MILLNVDLSEILYNVYISVFLVNSESALVTAFAKYTVLKI